MREDKVLSVFYREQLVGRLAMTKDGKVAFEYDDIWLEHGFSISPFSLPLEKKVFVPTKPYFGGLFGVFADSLPDAWGNVLLNRVLRKNGVKPDRITPLDRLAFVGTSGMGALNYQPEMRMIAPVSGVDYDVLARECQKILQSQESVRLDDLYRLGGTSGGARPKIMTEVDGEDWIIKFPAHIDSMNAGEMEYQYSLCAKECGIDMPDTKLFPSKECSGYFGIKRFDRDKGERCHMLTAAALLEVNFEEPSLDYHSLMKLTKILTRDCKVDVENMFLRMCFNVFAHNRDDHSKNFSFIYDDNERMWRLSPAYDLTYSTTYFGEHTTMVDGNGVNPGEKELLKVGMAAGMTKKRCNLLMEKVREKVNHMLKDYL